MATIDVDYSLTADLSIIRAIEFNRTFIYFFLLRLQYACGMSHKLRGKCFQFQFKGLASLGFGGTVQAVHGI